MSNKTFESIINLYNSKGLEETVKLYPYLNLNDKFDIYDFHQYKKLLLINTNNGTFFVPVNKETVKFYQMYSENKRVVTVTFKNNRFYLYNIKLVETID